MLLSETENLPYPDHTIDLDPNVRDAWGLPAPRITYDWRRPNERKAVAFIQDKLDEIGPRDGRDACVARAAWPAAHPARIPRAARAWAAIRRHRW